MCAATQRCAVNTDISSRSPPRVNVKKVERGGLRAESQAFVAMPSSTRTQTPVGGASRILDELFRRPPEVATEEEVRQPSRVRRMLDDLFSRKPEEPPPPAREPTPMRRLLDGLFSKAPERPATVGVRLRDEVIGSMLRPTEKDASKPPAKEDDANCMCCGARKAPPAV
eukprot:2606461-Prymnesium_polylepis.2